MDRTRDNSIRIGGASAFWGDSPEAALQLIERGDVDVVVFDYLSEVTMSILARAQSKNSEAGYAHDFPNTVMKAIGKQVVEKGVKVLANAGGINTAACRDALMKTAAELGVTFRVATVEGDDLRATISDWAGAIRDLDTGIPFPEQPWSVNAYLGALPIAAALDAGADVVITGRCVDSALVLGALISHYGWSLEDFDRLAAGSLAGHLLECGTQATGGNFTDWEEVTGWEDMGFPIAECYPDGSFVITKPDDTGGLVTPATVGEQMLYELGDPSAYVLPDVVCDFSRVELVQQAPDRVLVSGARGSAPTDTYKVCATYQDGFRSTAMFTMVGFNAAKKAQRSGEAIIERCRRILREKGLSDFRRVSLKLIGAEHLYGPHAGSFVASSREITLRLDVHHDDAAALAIFGREIAPAGTAMAPGRCSQQSGRPKATPLIRLSSFLLSKDKVPVRVLLDGGELVVPAMVEGMPMAGRAAASMESGQEVPAVLQAQSDTVNVPLLALAWGRSGDKGDSVNIGIIARRPEYEPVIRQNLTCEVVKNYFSHLVKGDVTRYYLPGIRAFNFVLANALDGGGIASLRNDPLGKTFAQMLLGLEIAVPRKLAQDHGLVENDAV